MATSQPPLTLDDINDPTGQRLHTYLRTLSSRLVATETELAAVKSAPTTKLDNKLVDQLTAHVSQQLLSTGAHPLSLTGLTGLTGQSQRAAVVVFTTDPTTTVNANLYDVGTMATFGAHIYYVAAGNPHTWVTII
jgi:hypothetical protein